MAVRNVMFDRGWRSITKLPRPVISIGNLTTGGTGKTPMVIDLARRLHQQGQAPAVLLRGYKSVNGQSDEAALLTNALGPGIPVQANPDRVAGAKIVLASNPGVTVFLLDDGFQHRQVHRDLNIVLVDALQPFGFEHLLPRGLLREPIQNLGRADAIIVTRADQADSPDQRIAAMGGNIIAHTAMIWTGLIDAQDQAFALDHLKTQNVLGVCGIGNPRAFEKSLSQIETITTQCAIFDDHHAYSQADLAQLITQHAPQAIVTTDKDWVKWLQLPIDINLPIYRPIYQLNYLDGEGRINALLKKLET
jgi:tetraacyldisaccharide 4'-kinase